MKTISTFSRAFYAWVRWKEGRGRENMFSLDLPILSESWNPLLCKLHAAYFIKMIPISDVSGTVPWSFGSYLISGVERVSYNINALNPETQNKPRENSDFVHAETLLVLSTIHRHLSRLLLLLFSTGVGL